MGRKRKAVLVLPEHVHTVKRPPTKKNPDGTLNYYYQRFRGTENEEPRIRLPDDPISEEFAKALKVAQDGATPGKFSLFIDAYTGSPWFQSRAKKTQTEYARYLEIARACFGRRDPRHVMPFHLANLRDECGSETPAKANNLIAAIGAMYAWGIELDWADTNPTHHVSRLEGGEYEPWPAEIWDLAMTNLRPDLRLACVFCLYTGQRISDVLAMNLEHVKDDQISVRQIKTGKPLWIPLHRELRPVVAERRTAGIGKMPLVMSPAGKHFTVDYFHAQWGLEMKKEPQGRIRSEGYVPHGLRKNAVNKLLESGCTTKEVEAITGQSLQIIEHYAKRANQPKLAASAMQKMEAQ
jgi:integrase